MNYSINYERVIWNLSQNSFLLAVQYNLLVVHLNYSVLSLHRTALLFFVIIIVVSVVVFRFRCPCDSINVRLR